MGTVLRSAGRARGSGWIVLAAVAGAVLAMGLAGCAGSGGSQSAGGGASGAGSSSSPSPSAVSALVPTSQLAAVGTIVAPGFAGTGAVATAGQAAPSQAPWFTSDLIVDPSQDFRAAIAIFGQASGDITAVTVNPDGTQTTLDNVAGSADNPIFSGDGKWLAYLPDSSDSGSVTQVYHLSGTSAQPIAFRVPSQTWPPRPSPTQSEHRSRSRHP